METGVEIAFLTIHWQVIMNQNPLLTKAHINANWTSRTVQSTAAIFVIGYMVKEEKMTRKCKQVNQYTRTYYPELFVTKSFLTFRSIVAVLSKLTLGVFHH